MQKNKLNHVLVLKELSSNIVEEAIVVLRPNIYLKQEESPSLEKSNKEKFVLTEAENVIQNYVVQLQNKDKMKANAKIEKKYKRLKIISLLLAIFNIFCIIHLF